MGAGQRCLVKKGLGAQAFDLFEEKLELVVWAGDREVNVVGGAAADEERALVVPLR